MSIQTLKTKLNEKHLFKADLPSQSNYDRLSEIESRQNFLKQSPNVPWPMIEEDSIVKIQKKVDPLSFTDRTLTDTQLPFTKRTLNGGLNSMPNQMLKLKANSLRKGNRNVIIL